MRLVVNGTAVDAPDPPDPRVLLADWLRETRGLASVHLGCEQGICGACTVLVDGSPVKSCLMLAVQAEGTEITTVEAVTAPGPLAPLQEAFHRHHALQCGFCTPGMLLAALGLVREGVTATEADVRAALGGNLCRCTGYQGIVEAVLEVLAAGREEARR